MLNLNTPLRAAQAALSILTLGLNGYVTGWYVKHTRGGVSPNATNFLLAVAGLTLLVLPYLFFNPPLSQTHHGRQSGRFFNKFVVLALDGILGIMWLAGFIDLAAFNHRLIICGGHCCQVMVGGTIVGAVTAVTFAVTVSLASLHIVRTRGGGSTKVAMTNHSNWVGRDGNKNGVA